MVSAGIPSERSFEPVLTPAKVRNWNHWYWISSLLLVLGMMAWISRYIGAGISSAVVAVFSCAAACGLLSLHLETKSYPWYWRYPVVGLLGCNMLLPILEHPSIPAPAWFAALGSGLFIYCMLWISAVYVSEPGLQPLATLALLLSIGILAKPAMAIACALLSILFFFHTRRSFGGITGYVFLLFTPAILCALAYFTLNLLITGSPQGDVAHPGIVSATVWTERFSWQLLSYEYSVILFPLGVLLARFFESKAGASDISYLMLLAFLTTAGVAYWMPQAMSAFDIRMIVYAGAACLLALAPPQKIPCRILVFVSACGALLGQI